MFARRGGQLLVHPFFFDSGPDCFQEGLACSVENGRTRFFDEAGCTLIEARFDATSPFSNGRAAACAGCKTEREEFGQERHDAPKGGPWGYLDRTGRLMIPFQFDSASPWAESTAGST